MDELALTRLIEELLGGAGASRGRIFKNDGSDDLQKGGLPLSAAESLVTRLTSAALQGQDIDLLSILVERTGDSAASGRFEPAASLAIVRIARLFALAVDALNDQAAAARFMLTPHPELNGKTPFDAALTRPGASEAEAIPSTGTPRPAGVTGAAPARYCAERAYNNLLN